MSGLKQRVEKLEQEGGKAPVVFIWVEPDSTEAERDALAKKRRREGSLPANTEFRFIGWMPTQEY